MLETSGPAINQAADLRLASREPVATWWRGHADVLAGLDVLAMAMAVAIAQAVRFSSLDLSQASTSRLSFEAVAAVIPLAWVFIMAIGGADQRRSVELGSEECRRVDSAVRFLALVERTRMQGGG